MEIWLEIIGAAITLWGIWHFWLNPKARMKFNQDNENYINDMNEKRNNSRPD